jgi:hypothetical protein
VLKVLFVQAKIDSLFSRDYALLGELSSGMSLRDIRNWLALAQRQAVSRTVANGGSAAYSMVREDLLDFAPLIGVSAQSRN